MHDLRQRAADQLTRLHGRGHWSNVGSVPTIRKHAAAGTLFGVERDSALIGTFTLSEQKIGFYHKSWFREPDAPALYLTNMAIDPAEQRKGIARCPMKYIERIARERELRALRFDAYDAPAGAGPFYRKCAYTLVHRGTIGAVGLEYYEKAFLR